DEADADDALRDDRAARHDDAVRRRGGREDRFRAGRRAPREAGVLARNLLDEQAVLRDADARDLAVRAPRFTAALSPLPRARGPREAAKSSTPLREVVVRVRHLERLVREAAQEVAELVADVGDDVVALRLDVRARA